MAFAFHYKIRFDAFPSVNEKVAEMRPDTNFETPYELTTIVELKDGKSLTLIGLREDIFRKRL